MGLRALLTSLGLGAGAMYFLDPEQGNRRRALVRDQWVHLQHEAEDLWGKGTRDLQNRAEGMEARTQSVLESGMGGGQRNRQAGWLPGARLLALGGGAILALYGLIRGGIIGSLLAVGGVVLMLRAFFNKSIKGMVGQSSQDAIEFRKGLQVNAPVEEVFEFWRNYDNFPRFMSHLVEVRDVGNGNSHWVAQGPAGARVEWDASITEMQPNRVLAWESEPGSQVFNAGRVSFTPEGNRTRIDIQMRYSPPGGAAGHLVASLFGSDPKTAMDEDLVRFKSLIEHGKTTAGGQQVSKEEVRSSQGMGGQEQWSSERTSSNDPETWSRGESGMPGGGQRRVDEVGQSGVYPASGPLPEGDADVQGMASWGQGERGAEGYYDSGQSELPMREEPDLDEM